jgi:hypothetical protein
MVGTSERSTTQMTKGRIEIRKLDLMGFTPETQVYFIQNGGGAGSVDTFHFLQAHRKYFDHNLFMGRTYNALVASRVAKFKEYATSKGFEVVEAGRI